MSGALAQPAPDLARDAGDAYLADRGQAAAVANDARLARLMALDPAPAAAPAAPGAADTGIVDGAAAAPAAKSDWLTGWLKRAFPETVKAPVGSAMPGAVDAAGAAARDIGKGVGVEGAGAVYRGAVGAAEEILRTGDALANWLNANVADLTIGGSKEQAAASSEFGGNPLKNLADKFAAAKGAFAPRTTVTGQLIEGTAQWLTSVWMTGNVARALGVPANIWTNTIVDVAAGAVGFDPRAARVSNAIDDAAPNPVTEFLKADAEDPELVARLKNGLETAGLAKIAEGVIGALRFLKAAQSSAAAPKIEAPKGDAPRPVEPAAPPAAETPAPGPAPAAGGKPASLADELANLERPRDLQAPHGVVEIPADVAEKARAFLAGEISDAPVRVNLARLQGPEDIRAAIGEISKALPEHVPVSNATTLAEARDLGMTAQELVDGIAGNLFDRRQITAARILFRSSMPDVIDAARRATASGAAEDKAAFEQAYAKAYAILAAGKNQTTEIARALQVHAIEAKADDAATQAVRALMTRDMAAGQGAAPGAVIDALGLAGKIASFDNPELAAAFLARTARPQTTRDQIVFWWSNILLSNPASHIANVVDTAASTLLQVPETWVASKLGAHVDAAEASARLYGVVQGMRDGVRAAARALRTGESQFGGPAVRVEGAFPAADLVKEGPAAQMGDYLKMLLPTRLMMAGDELTKAMNYRGELNRLAYRRAALEEGLTGDALKRRIGALVDAPPKWLDDAAQNWAIAGTFNKELTGTAANVAAVVDGMNVPVGGGLVLPVGRVIMPFVRTPANILSWVVQRTPAAFLSPAVQADIAAGGAARDLALARVATGSAMLGAFADQVLQGNVTGAGPKDPGLRANLLRQDANGNAQWQPYSIKAGDTWYSYSRSGTIGALVGIAADAAELISGVYSRDPKAVNMDGTPVEDGAAAAVVFPFAAAILSKTYMSGLSQLLDALADPHRNGEPYLQRTLASIVPSGVGAVERAIDGEMRRAQGYLDAVQSRIPGLSDGLPPRLTLWGDPVRDVNGIYNLFLPVRRMDDGGWPIDRWMAEAKVSIQPPGQVQSFGAGPARVAVKLTPEQHNKLIALAGNEAKSAENGLGARDLMNAIVEGNVEKAGRSLVEEWKTGADEKRELILRDVVARYREAARKRLLAEDGDLRTLVQQQSQARGEKITAPRAGAASPSIE